MISMSNVFCQHQLLRCQTIGQCMMLNADVRKRGKVLLVKCGHLRTGGGVMKSGHFLRTSFMDDPLMNALYVIFLCARALLVTRIRGHPFMTSTKKSGF